MGLADTVRWPWQPKVDHQMTKKALYVVAPDDLLSAADVATSGDTPVHRRLDPTVLLEEGLAAAALAMEDYASVADHCSQIVQVCPDHYEAWFNLGYSRQQTGEIEESILAYHQAVRLAPDDPRPWLNLGLARHAVDDFDGAKEAYQRALALDLDQPAALWNLGLILERSGAHAEAASLYSRLVDSSPELADAWFRLGFACGESGDVDGAVDAYRQCLEQNPDFSAAALNMAVCLLESGQPSEARQVLDDLLLQEPDHVEALRAVASTAVELGDWELCRAVRERLAEMRQSSPEISYNVALVFDREQHQEEAIRYYCEALRENPRFSGALLNLGHLLARQGKQAEARECWKRALVNDQALALAYFNPERQPT